MRGDLQVTHTASTVMSMPENQGASVQDIPLDRIK